MTLHSEVAGNNGAVDALLLEDALRRLERESKQACRIVEMRVFGGMTVAETAELLGLSESTVKRQWVFAKTWLKRISRGRASHEPAAMGEAGIAICPGDGSGE